MKRSTTLAAILAFVAMVAPVAGHAEVQPVGTLGVGDSVFWDGPYIERTGTPRAAEEGFCRGLAGSMWGCIAATAVGSNVSYWESFSEPGCSAPDCHHWPLDVTGDGSRLRIALDKPDMRDGFEIVVINPANEFVGAARGAYSMELAVDDPPPGRWNIYVYAYDVEDSAFRMRAYVEPEPPALGAPTNLLPNLKATPPFDLVFGGCQATEIAQYGPARCLRFSAGPANVGDGPLDLRIEDVGATTGANEQWIHRSDGTFDVRTAGTFEWHSEHLHYHHVGTGEYRLYRVVDEQTGQLELSGSGPKVGFCMGDYLIGDWRSFEQDKRFSGSGSCNGAADAPLGVKMGLTKGWGDIYSADVEGNFVDFGANSDGRYVVRVATDATNDITELVENDNHGYAYFEVAGDVIHPIERGYGLSPWDPEKEVVDDQRKPTS